MEKRDYIRCVDNSILDFKTIENNIHKNIGYIIIKRMADFMGALIGLILLSPIFLIVAISIKIEDPKGKIIFGHKRVGLNGKIFKCWKFRSMVHNAEEILNTLTPEQKKEYSETFKLKEDPRITKVGNFIRKTSLDELPQLINILMGQMSIVGPRPIVTKELEFYGEYAQYLKSIKPGLTGLWQVSGRSDTTYEERVELDMEYVVKRGVFLDIYIIFMTFIKVIKREGAC